MNIPELFSNGVITERGEAGRNWLLNLPSTLEHFLDAWNLTIDGDLMHGYIAVVVPVRREDELLVLKINWVDDETKDEAAALEFWNGNGAVRLINSDREQGVLLLERLNQQVTLKQLKIGSAVEVAGHLLRRLAVPAPEGIQTLSDSMADFASSLIGRWESCGKPFSQEVAQAAKQAALDFGPDSEKLLVNFDLHYDNVLGGTREPWLVIDPKVIAGDLEYGCFPLLINRLEPSDASPELEARFSILLDAAHMDESRARAWTLVRCIDYWLWALEQGYSDDTQRCRTIADWLMES